MPILRLCRRLLASGAALGLLAGFAAGQTGQPEVTGKKFNYVDATKETVVTGDARLTYEGILLTADEIHYSATNSTARAVGHFKLTYGQRRLVADEGTFNLRTKTLHVRHLRVGEFPIYLSGDTVDGTLDNLVFTNATVFFRENAGYTPSIHAKRLTYAKGKIVSADGLTLGLLGGRFISLPHFEQRLNSDFISYLSATFGYRGNLGVFTKVGLHVPVGHDANLGADVGLYSSRGVMAGPSGNYHHTDATNAYDGVFRSGFIYDLGHDRGIDILGDAIPHGRSFVEWTHRQQIGEHLSIDGQVNYWSDSAVLRDFNNSTFNRVQQPDSYLEGAYTGDNYVFSVFTRANPNPYFLDVRRLPELRFDLLPTALPLGFYERFNASAAVLESAAVAPAPTFHTTRLDAYYGLERPLTPVPWFSVTPVAGGRVTHYTDALGGRPDYTRTLGEVGFDAHLLSSATFDYKNPVWEIDGLRHLVEPKLSYRYAPEAARGAAYIPPVDTRAFTTYLPPLSVADSRNLDQLAALNTARLELDNTLQTRDAAYGSRNLASLNFATDYRFDHPAGQHALSDVYTEFTLTPAPWLRWEVFHRFDLNTNSQDELNTAINLVDQEWWTARLSSHFLRHNYEEYDLEYRQRLNEAFDVTGLWRYDAQDHRFNEQSYGIWQRLGQTWAVKYEVSFYNGNTRSNHFAFNVEVQLLKF